MLRARSGTTPGAKRSPVAAVHLGLPRAEGLPAARRVGLVRRTHPYRARPRAGARSPRRLADPALRRVCPLHLLVQPPGLVRLPSPAPRERTCRRRRGAATWGGGLRVCRPPRRIGSSLQARTFGPPSRTRHVPPVRPGKESPYHARRRSRSLTSQSFLGSVPRARDACAGPAACGAVGRGGLACHAVAGDGGGADAGPGAKRSSRTKCPTSRGDRSPGAGSQGAPRACRGAGSRRGPVACASGGFRSVTSDRSHASPGRGFGAVTSGRSHASPGRGFRSVPSSCRHARSAPCLSLRAGRRRFGSSAGRGFHPRLPWLRQDPRWCLGRPPSRLLRPRWPLPCRVRRRRDLRVRRRRRRQARRR